MKKLIFIFLAFWSLSVSAQTTSFSVVSDPNNPSNLVDCNCYLFSVTDPTIMPFYDPEHDDYPDNPGFSYLWVWGDGTHTFATEASTSHCFDGNIDSYNIEMHFTPRKRPREPRPSSIALTNFNGIILPDLDDPFETCSTPAISGTTGLSVGRDLKDDEDFLLIVEAKSCQENSEFTVTFDENLIEFVSYPDNLSHLPPPTAGSFVFTQNGDEFNRYYVLFHVKDTTEITTIPVDADFSISRSKLNIDPDPNKVDSNSVIECQASFTLIEEITSGPYDPNIIESSHGQNLNDCDISGETITYVMQFENEGMTETNFVGLDIHLDPNLIASSFEIIRIWNSQDSDWPELVPNTLQTHYYTHTESNSSNKTIDCIGLMLDGHQNNNLSARKGFIEFSAVVDPQFNLTPTNSLTTYANVIFNQNDPMRTNDAITSCAESGPSCCAECEVCRCKECTCGGTNTWTYILGVIGAIVLALIARFFMKRSKP